MLFTTALLATFVGLTSATAQPITGNVKCCVTVSVDADGNASFNTGPKIVLDNGTTLTNDAGKWTASPASSQGITDVKPLDMAVYFSDYIGKRVRVTSRIWSVAIDSAIFDLPGHGTASVEMSAVPRDQLKSLIETCGGFLPTTPACTVTLVGTPARRSFDQHPMFTDVVITTPTSTRITPR